MYNSVVKIGANFIIKSSVTVVMMIFLIGNVFARQSSTIAEIKVKSGEYEYYNAPVTKSLQGVELKLHKGELRLYEITEGNEIAVESQLKPGNQDQLTWILLGKTEPGSARNYVLKVVDTHEAGSRTA
ncbi:MAG: hypothetical protein EA359_15825, partial [Balneolaceae bacterium]